MSLPGRPNTKILRIVAGWAILVFVVWSVLVWRRPAVTKPPAVNSHNSSATYIGVERCAGCHAQAAEAWRHSHHARAMEEANSSTVLGDFHNSRFTKDGLTSSFFMKDEKPYVRT